MKINNIYGVLRISMGWIFFWAFIDKLWGLGFATTLDKAWLMGNSPTVGYLSFGTKGPLAELFQGMAGSPLVDWLFMLGLLGIGVALILGIGMRIAGYAGALMMILMYLAGSIWPDNNPFIDDHVIYALVLLGLGLSDSGNYLGLGKWWSETLLVKKYSILK